ncbi:MAG: hypothetical protein ACK5XN_09610 [Bacteroidota bacterium]
MYDDEGQIVRRHGKLQRREGKTPCDSSLKCPKGHYSENPDLTAGEEAVLTLWRSQSTLTDAERKDDFLCGAFAALSEQKERIDRVLASRAAAGRLRMGSGNDGD